MKEKKLSSSSLELGSDINSESLEFAMLSEPLEHVLIDLLVKAASEDSENVLYIFCDID